MARGRTILLVLLGIVVLALTIYFTLNGFSSLTSLNPHAR
jgi:hypothetical protein